VQTTVSKEASGQLQRLGVAEAQVDPAAQLVGLASGQLQHGGAEVGPGQADAFWVEGEVAAGADGHLKDVAGGLRADPVAAVPEQPALEEGDLLVVLGGLLIPVAA
jgi:hypothetical protein